MLQLVSDSRAFPAAPPTDLGAADEIVANDWSAFTGIERMTNHWDRPGWSPGHRAYYWMLSFPDVDDLINEAGFCQRQIAELSLDEVPADGLHITMNKIGDCSDLTTSTVDRLAELARGAADGPFSLLAHPMAGSRGAVRFSVSPWTPLVRLYESLSAIGRRVGAPRGKPTRAFRPHLSIAYSSCDQPAAPVVEAVTPLRARAAVHVPVGSVDLVELHRKGTVYRWDTLHRVSLVTPTPPPGSCRRC